MLTCIKCGSEISPNRKSVKYCSDRCGKNYLKSGWRKRNRITVNSYNKGNRSGKFVDKKDAQYLPKEFCLRCGSGDNLNYHHVKPTRVGGRNDLGNIIVLCFPCHMLWHDLFPNHYWKVK